MKTLTIHDVKEDFFSEISFHEYLLTFDDGLFSQYFYWPIFRQIPTMKTFFISTNLIGIDGLGKRKRWKGKFQKFPTCFKALADFRETGNRENYMRLEELKEIMYDGGIIGAHGHNHMHFMTYNEMIEDIESMLEWFEKHLKIRPTEYAFPHYEKTIMLIFLLKKYGFTKFYGDWRIEIEEEKDLLSNV